VRAIRLTRPRDAGAGSGTGGAPLADDAGASSELAPGAILAHDVRDAQGRVAVAKGTQLDADAVARLRALSWHELHLLVPGPGDVHEGEAGQRLAQAAAGAGVVVGALSGGAWPMQAAHRGILAVHRPALEAVNLIDGLSVYTLFDGQVVAGGETVARAKIVPFVIAQATLAQGETAARAEGGVVRVRPFHPMVVGAVVQESLGARAMTRFEAALGEKVRWFGSTLLAPAFVAPERDEIASGIARQVADGAEIVALAGSRPMDPLDPVFDALAVAGAVMVRQGVPAHPGSLVWLARLGRVPIIGMPACGLFSQATVFDLILPRLLTGERVTGRDLASLGHGGFLTRDMAFRFPPYREARERGAVEEP
jgi:molybdenum cofactor cytidylyltransferase